MKTNLFDSSIFKNLITLLLFFAFSLLTVRAQTEIGLRESRYIYGAYTWLDRYSIKLEESVFPQQLTSQYLRGYVGFHDSIAYVDYSLDAFYGQTYNSSYYSFGFLAQVVYHPFKILDLSLVVNPLYDSGFKYETCFEILPQVKLTEDISAMVGYSDIPDYRMKDKRIKFGLGFRSGPLQVNPCITLPIEGNSKMKLLRVRVSMKYLFGK